MAVDEPQSCDGGAVDVSRQALRISSIFIMLISSLIGTLAPILLARQTYMHIPATTFFVFKFVGTGVIIGTAFLHLLEPALENFGDACVVARVPDYPWAVFIALLTVIVMFLIELIVTSFQEEYRNYDGDALPLDFIAKASPSQIRPPTEDCPYDNTDLEQATGISPTKANPRSSGNVGNLPGDDGKLSTFQMRRRNKTELDHKRNEGIAGQLTAIFVLEFGVVFHSVFIGLVLGTTDQIVVLLIVFTFHQMFEGLGLGSRLAVISWPKSKGWMPYALAVGFAISTPISVAAGIGTRPANATSQKLVNAVFDSISAGILLYTGLVELIAHEFMFNNHMRRSKLKVQLLGFGCIAFGVVVMSILAIWA